MPEASLSSPMTQPSETTYPDASSSNYVDPDALSDMKNVRWRHNKSNMSTAVPTQPAHFILTAGDFPSNETDLRFSTRKNHNRTQIVLLILTALVYLLQTLRAYIPEAVQITSHFWSSIRVTPLARVYTSDLRPSLAIEHLLLRIAENWQAFWLVYVLSYIPRRSNLGYLYRVPDVFNSSLCLLLIGALALQVVSQSIFSLEIVSICLLLSSILLLVVCRQVMVKLTRFEDKYKSLGLSVDWIVLRYFVLNSLVLYTTSIIYCTICTAIECSSAHFHAESGSSVAADIPAIIGLTVTLILLLIYSCLEHVVYWQELRSVWTPYLFLLVAFVCPPLRPWVFIQSDSTNEEWHDYLFWVLFGTTMLMLCVRSIRQGSRKCRELRKKLRMHSYLKQVNSGGES